MILRKRASIATRYLMKCTTVYGDRYCKDVKNASSSQHGEVLLRSSFGSTNSLDASNQNARNKEASGLESVQQQLCNALTDTTKKCYHYTREASRDRTDGDTSVLRYTGIYSRALTASTFSPFAENGAKLLLRREALLNELPEKRFKLIDSVFIELLDISTCFGHAF